MKIISGGQSGVDRAALDAAIGYGIAYGGWCPHGGWAEDFPEPPGVLAKYPRLQETPSAEPAQRTEWNVRDADATLIIVDTGGLAVSRGTRLAGELAGKYRKPLLVIDLRASDRLERTAAWLRTLIEAHGDDLALGIGGPRESEAPGIYAKARSLIAGVLVSASKA
jgi:Circularly permutated YpsA SLOG family